MTLTVSSTILGAEGVDYKPMNSAGLMYNALWARLLGIEFVIPGFYPLFRAHYAFLSTVTVNATWCIPLSSMEHDSKWDWLVYSELPCGVG